MKGGAGAAAAPSPVHPNASGWHTMSATLCSGVLGRLGHPVLGKRLADEQRQHNGGVGVHLRSAATPQRAPASAPRALTSPGRQLHLEASQACAGSPPLPAFRFLPFPSLLCLCFTHLDGLGVQADLAPAHRLVGLGAAVRPVKLLRSRPQTGGRQALRTGVCSLWPRQLASIPPSACTWAVLT